MEELLKGTSVVGGVIIVEGDGVVNELEDSVRLDMVSSFHKSAPKFTSAEVSAEGIRNWVIRIEDHRRALRMPFKILMEVVISRSEDAESNEDTGGKGGAIKFTNKQLLGMYTHMHHV
jgi:hypothetical protein